MIGRKINNLNRQRVRQLLSAVGSGSAEDIAQPEFTEYDWKDPHYFTEEQLAKLNGFSMGAARAMSTKFSDYFRTRFDVKITAVTQHFAGDYFSKVIGGDQHDYFVPFGVDPEHSCGFIGIPNKTAGDWAGQLLGDSEAQEDSAKELSSLEESLLVDLALILIEAFFEFDAALNFNLSGSLVKGMIPVNLSVTEEICRIEFDVKKSGSEEATAAYLIIRCRELASLTGKAITATKEFSENEITSAVTEHLNDMKISVTAQLDKPVLTFEDVMNLQVNDLLILDKTVDDPIDLVVEGRTLFNGRPAKSAGKYAVVIAAMMEGDAA